MRILAPKASARLATIVLALILGTLASAGPSQAESVVRIAMTLSDIPDWTGETDQGAEGWRFVGYTIYEGLVGWDLSRSDAESNMAPALATKWYIDPDNHNRWIFELRQGVKFQDGCAWNADNALWNFDRVMNNKAAAFSVLHTSRVLSSTTNIDHVEKIDDYKIAIYTKQLESLFPINTTRILMLSPCAVEKAGYDWSVYAKAPAGTGPYKFDKAVPHERLELVKNPDYWNKDRIPKHDRLVLVPMAEATTRVAALLSGQVDFIEAPPPDAIDKLKSAGMNVITNAYPHTWDYILNFQHGPFQDLRVRQAANFAINRDEVVELVGGTGTQAYGIFMPSSKYYGHPFQYKTDPAKATALLKEANCYPCRIKVAISPSGSGQMEPLPMNELVKSQLDAVGFDVSFDVVDWNALAGIWHDGWQKHADLDAVNISYNSLDPEVGFLKTLLTSNRAPNGVNWGWYKNDEVERLANEVESTFDETKQTTLLRQIHELVVQDAQRIFIVDDLNPRALSPRLKGFVQAQNWYQDFTPIVVTDSAK